jgi:two-component system response regulator FixJ
MRPSAEVYVVDADLAAARSLGFLLSGAGFTPHLYAGGPALLDDCDRLPAGCVIAPLGLARLGSFELIRRLNAENGGFGVIVTADDSSVAKAVEAMKAGAVDFIETPCADEVMLEAVHSAAQADVSPSPRRASQRREHKALAKLTPRERDVLAGVVAGKTSKTIARDCGISPRTVEVHRANVMTKSGARSLSELVRMALVADESGPANLADWPEAA